MPVNGISAVLFLFFQCFLSGLRNMGAMKPQLMEVKKIGPSVVHSKDSKSFCKFFFFRFSFY